MEQFSYSDAGISLNVNLSQGYSSLAGMLLNGYIQQRDTIKRSMRPNPAGIKSGQPAIKIRSYARATCLVIKSYYNIIKNYYVLTILNYYFEE